MKSFFMHFSTPSKVDNHLNFTFSFTIFKTFALHRPWPLKTVTKTITSNNQSINKDCWLWTLEFPTSFAPQNIRKTWISQPENSERKNQKENWKQKSKRKQVGRRRGHRAALGANYGSLHGRQSSDYTNFQLSFI